MAGIDLLGLTGVAGCHVERLMRLLVSLPADIIATLTGLVKLHIARLLAQIHDRSVAGVLNVALKHLRSVHIR